MSRSSRPASPSVISHLDAQGLPASRLRLAATPAQVERLMQARHTPADRYAIGDPMPSTDGEVVAQAYDFDLQREVVLRVLAPAHRDDGAAIAELVEEAQLWAQLQHPNILPVYELGLMDDRRPFVTARRFHGRTLSSLVGEGGSAGDRRRLLGMLEPACQAMAYAHARGVAHGELSADCILIGDHREVQIVGWERARPPQPTAEGDTLQPARPHDDVEALGRLLAAVLLRRPVSADEDRAALQDEVGGAGERDVHHGPLVDLVLACLQDDPSRRPASAGPVAERLSRHLAELERRAQRTRVEAFEAEVRGREARRVAEADRRARRRQLLLLLLVLAILVGAGLTWAGIQAAAETREAAADQEVGERVDAARTLREDGRIREAAVEARTALDLAITREASPPVRGRAQTLASTLEAEVEAMDARDALARSNRDLLGQLEEIERLRHEGVGIEETVASARAVLAEHGLDPYELGAVASVEALLARGQDVAERVSVLYDAWAVNCALPKNLDGEPELPDWRVLADTAAAIATDPVRDVVRAFLADRDYARLVAEAEMLDPSVVPADSLVLMAGEIASSSLHWEDAANLLRRSVLHHPHDFWVHWQLAEYLGSLVPAESFLHYEAALAVEPKSPMALSGVAVYYLGLGQHERALDFADRALAARPERRTARALTVKGRLAGLQGDRETALAYFEEATRAMPRWPYAWHTLGVGLTLAGRVEEAVEPFRRAAELQPENTMKVVAYAVSLDSVERRAEAEAVIRQHIAEQQATPVACIWLAAIVGKQERWAEAVAILEEANRSHPRNWGLQNDLAYFLMLAPQPVRNVPRALELSAQCLELGADLPQTHGTAGIIAYRRGELDRAEELLRKSIAMYPRQDVIPPNEARLWLAMTLDELGRPDEARAVWDEAQRWRAGFQGDAWYFDRVAEEAAPRFR